LTKREQRRVLATLNERERIILETLNEFEKEEIEPVPLLSHALRTTPVEFMVFACLGTKKGAEELKLDLYETIFLKHFRRIAEKLFRALAGRGVEATLRIILPDLERRRTWGWQVPQEDLTGFCQMMVEDATAQLPKGWRASTWSDLERQTPMGTEYDRVCDWAESSAHPLILKDERLFFQELERRHPEILTRRDAETMARRQIAAYAHEGRVLEQIFPNAILLQTDTPVKRKDLMFQTLRKQSLPIAHPFTN